MAKKIKYNGTNATESYASSGGSIPGITGSESVTRNYFLHQLLQWQSDQNYKTTRSDLEGMFSYFPLSNAKIRANVMTRSSSTFSESNSYVKSINYLPPKAVRQRTYTSGSGTLPTTRSYMRYLMVGGGGGGGKGTSPALGTGIGGAGGGGGAIAYGEALIGGYEYQVGAGGNGATAHGNSGSTGGAGRMQTPDYSSYIIVRGGAGGGNETLYGNGGSANNNLTDNLSGGIISGRSGGRNRAAGSSRSVPSLTNNQTLGLGDLIDGGKGHEWRNLLLNSTDYFGAIYYGDDLDGGTGVDNMKYPAPGGEIDNVNGGGGGGGASMGRGGRYPRSGSQTYPVKGGGGGGAPGKGNNGQAGASGFIHIFW